MIVVVTVIVIMLVFSLCVFYVHDYVLNTRLNINYCGYRSSYAY